MARNESLDSIKRILQVAEELFSEKGFNGTSVNMIAEKAEVNKALIYYHFKDKNDIINSMFENIIKESEEHVGRSLEASFGNAKETHKKDAIEEEIKFMFNRRKIMSVMMMESLKGDDKDNYFFKCAESVFKNELKMFTEKYEAMEEHSEEIQRELVHEFFTGFVPIIAFVVYYEKWCEYFKCDREKVMGYFMDSFHRSHLTSKHEK